MDFPSHLKSAKSQAVPLLHRSFNSRSLVRIKKQTHTHTHKHTHFEHACLLEPATTEPLERYRV